MHWTMYHFWLKSSEPTEHSGASSCSLPLAADAELNSDVSSAGQ